MKYLTAILLSLSFMLPAVAQQPQEKPKTEMKLAKKKADKDREAKEKKAQAPKEAKK
jgi:hypothetical protein